MTESPLGPEAVSASESRDPPESLLLLIEQARVVRNLREQANHAHRRFILEMTQVELTPEVLTWAMTATANNTPSDALTVAQWVIGVKRGRYATR